ncbi:MAG TPA: hypothetical protein VLF91_03500 [Candidatus Saccharimonadales bacterium]|nr:hypothetical protein [Candidatus Saccharimonadales bacterium]
MTERVANYQRELTDLLAGTTGKERLFRAAVNAPFQNKVEAARMYLGIVVLLVVDSKGVIHRVALSNTELAKGTTSVSVKKFEDIKVPLEDADNVVACAIRTGTPQATADWHYLFTPALTAEEARFNQAAGAIAYSAVYPLPGKRGGALIFSYYQYPERIGRVQKRFMAFYSQLVSQHLAAFL